MKPSFSPVPKPEPDKRKKAYNGYKDKPNRFCYYCGTPSAERHEIFGGANRQTSIVHGFQVDLCRECHEGIHDKTGIWQERARWWKQRCQTAYEDKLVDAGISAKQARSLWMKLIGKNYLE